MIAEMVTGVDSRLPNRQIRCQHNGMGMDVDLDMRMAKLQRRHYAEI